MSAATNGAAAANAFRLLSVRSGALLPFAVQVLALSVPFIIVPYLTRVLDARSFGEFAFCQAFATVGAAVVDYGFQISATRSLAETRDDPAVTRRRSSGILTAKLLIASLYVAAVLAFLPVYPAFFRAPEMIASAIGFAVFQGLNFYWLFAGLQRILLASLLDLGARFVGGLGILLFVRGPQQAWVAVACFAVGNALAFAFAFFFALGLTGFRLSSAEAKKSLLAGRHIFVQSVFGNIYVGATSFFLGLFVSPYFIGTFSAAEKLVRAAQLPLLPFRLVAYPRVVATVGQSREAGRALILRLAGIVLPVMALGSLILFFAAGPIVRLILGPKLAPAADLLRLMAFVPLLSSATDLISVFWLLSNGRDRIVTVIVIAGLACQVLTIVGFAVFWPRWAGAAAVTLSQTVVLLMCLWAIWRGESAKNMKA
jgi:PST family polysaccharide transporter